MYFLLKARFIFFKKSLPPGFPQNTVRHSVGLWKLFNLFH